MKRILIYILFLLAFSQCNKIEEVGQGANAIYIDEAQNSNSVQVTIPAGATSNTFSLTPKLVYTIGQDVTVNFNVSPELITDYNNKNGTNYVVIPSGNYELLENATTIPANSSAASPIQIKFNSTDTLNRINKYILPVTITTISNGLTTITSSKTMYYIVDNSVLISTAAVLTNNSFAPSIIGSANAGKMSALTQFTFEALVNVNAFRSTSSEAGISALMGIEGYLLIRFGDAGLDPNKLQLATSVGNIATTVPVNTGKWTHIAVTYDGTTIKIYIDGTLVSSAPIALGVINLASSSRDPFYIGKSYNDSRWLDGAISECRVWSVARTIDQLGGDNKYKVDPTSTGLVAYWKFNEGSGNNAKDYTGNGFDAVAKNNASWISVKLP